MALTRASCRVTWGITTWTPSCATRNVHDSTLSRASCFSKIFSPVEVIFSRSRLSATSSWRTASDTMYTRFGAATSAVRVTRFVRAGKPGARPKKSMSEFCVLGSDTCTTGSKWFHLPFGPLVPRRLRPPPPRDQSSPPAAAGAAAAAAGASASAPSSASPLSTTPPSSPPSAAAPAAAPSVAAAAPAAAAGLLAAGTWSFALLGSSPTCEESHTKAHGKEQKASARADSRARAQRTQRELLASAPPPPLAAARSAGGLRDVRAHLGAPW